MAAADLTAARLRELFHYDPTTGVFTRLVSPTSWTKVGEVAGWTNAGGYVVIRIAQRDFLAHRLAWLYVHGHWPEREIDHRNRLRSDNRIANLRDITHAQNTQNDHGPRSNNKSGFRGVDWCQRSYRARVYADGKVVFYRAGFSTAADASAAYEAARRHLHPYSSAS